MLCYRKVKALSLYLMIILISFSFSNIGILGNSFVFVIPWLLFCLMNNRNYGIVAFFACFFSCFSKNNWMFLVFLFIFLSFIIFIKYIKVSDRKLLDKLSFFAFFSTFISGLICLLIGGEGNFIYCFFTGVMSYWLMRSFYDIYYCVRNKEDSSYKNTVFLLFIMGVFILGLDLSLFIIDISLIGVVLLSFIAGNVGKEEGIMYSFLISVMFAFIRKVDVLLVIFVVTSILSSLLNKVSKGILFLTYVGCILLFLNYYNIPYLEGINYFIGCLLYVLIPFKNTVLISKEKYIEKLIEDDKKGRIVFSNKLEKMNELFSFTKSKLFVKGRLKKNDRLLLSDEVSVFNDILARFSDDIRDNKEKYKNKIERELYKYSFDVLNVKVNKNIMGEYKVFISVRCNETEIEDVVIPLVNKVIKTPLKMVGKTYNNIFKFYEIELINKIMYYFKFGVSQMAKNGVVCGDSYLIFDTEKYKIFLLSDGMGYGEEAKFKSKAAINMFKKYIDIGFSVKSCIKSLNNVLKGEYSKEGYTTLDLFVFDKIDNKFYFSKNGACDSYVLRDDNVLVIEGNDLPLGIIDKIDSSVHSLEIEDNDYIVMVSDGVSESCLRKCKSKDPSKMVKEIIERQKEINDDASVLVINIKKREY